MLNIRSGVTFHDGTPVDAEAVKFNLERNKGDAKSNIKADLASVDYIAVTGPMQVTLKLKNAEFGAAGHPVRPGRHDGVADSAEGERGRWQCRRASPLAQAPTPSSAGPTANASWSSATKNTGSRTGPIPTASRYSIIPELAHRRALGHGGSERLMYQLPPRQKAILERTQHIKIVNGPTLYVFQIFLNWAKPPFDDVKVRKAFNFAIDREAFVKAALAGLAEPAYMNLPKSHWAYDKLVAELYPYNPDMSKKLLAEAGQRMALSIDLVGYPDQDSVQRQEILIEYVPQGRHECTLHECADRGSVRRLLRRREAVVPNPRSLDGAAGPEPDLFADVHQGRLL